MCARQWSVLGENSRKNPTSYLKLVPTEGYGERATAIKGQNALFPTLCFAQVSHEKNTHD